MYDGNCIGQPEYERGIDAHERAEEAITPDIQLVLQLLREAAAEYEHDLATRLRTYPDEAVYVAPHPAIAQAINLLAEVFE